MVSNITLQSRTIRALLAVFFLLLGYKILSVGYIAYLSYVAGIYLFLTAVLGYEPLKKSTQISSSGIKKVSPQDIERAVQSSEAREDIEVKRFPYTEEKKSKKKIKVIKKKNATKKKNAPKKSSSVTKKKR